ncbi:MAG: helix-turn-helix domain-containing protein [Nanoarchaeota archaeon]
MITRLFNSVGMTQNESKVYMTLLDLGSAQAGQITEKSGIHRRNVYDAISRLMEKGLASFVTVNNNKTFSPVHPKRFFELIEEKKLDLEILRNDFSKVMPELELKEKLQHRHDVRFFKGIEGLKSVYENIINTSKSYVGIGLGQHLEKIMSHYFTHFVERRQKMGIKIKIIYSEDSRGKIKKTPLSELRYMPQEYSSRTALRIYGDKVATLLLEKGEPQAIVIKNNHIANGYRKYFEFMWKAASK